MSGSLNIVPSLVAISFVSAGDITYYYQLKGLDSTWQTTKQNSVEFESLPPGTYQFNIYALNKYGIKSKTLSISFTKAKVFWQFISVRIILIIGIALLIGLMFRARIRVIRKNANEKVFRERKMHEIEQMALRSQMNPHFIFNSLNSIQQYIFTGDVVEANRFITNFSSMVRQTLDLSQKKLIKLEEEVKYLDTYLNIERIKHEDYFNYTIEFDETLAGILIPSLLLQPFVENSIRHGVLNLEKGEGTILVKFLVQNNALHCIIKDNGIGRTNSFKLKRSNVFHQHQSKGLDLVQKRIESLNSFYNIHILVLIDDIEKQNDNGTCVILKLPLHYDE